MPIIALNCYYMVTMLMTRRKGQAHHIDVITTHVHLLVAHTAAYEAPYTATVVERLCGKSHFQGPPEAHGRQTHAERRADSDSNASTHPSQYSPRQASQTLKNTEGAGWRNARVVGISNMDEFGMGSGNAFSHFGPAYNPYSAATLISRIRAHSKNQTDLPPPDETCWLSPGGSSGGGAVAVAAGLADLSIGSDTGGSVRMPAAFCGVTGFKPSYGRIPRWGLIAYASSLDTIGFLANDVQTCARALDVAGGRDPKDDTSVDYSDCALDAVTNASSLHSVRVGLPAEAHVQELAPSVRAAWARAARALAAAGAQVVTVSLPCTRDVLAAYYVIAAAEAASNLSRYDGVRYGYRAELPSSSNHPYSGSGDTGSAAALHRLYTLTRSQGFGPEVQRRIMAGNFALSRSARAAYYNAATALRRRLVQEFNCMFRPVHEPASHDARVRALGTYAAQLTALGGATQDAGVDMLLLPTAPFAPWVSSETARQPPAAMYVNDVMTVPASLARLPAISVPVGLAPYPIESISKHILDAYGQELGSLRVPIGMQVVGRALDDASVLRVATVLERSADFKAPAYVACRES